MVGVTVVLFVMQVSAYVGLPQPQWVAQLVPVLATRLLVQPLGQPPSPRPLRF